jgi:glycosyltransferase involved in cell wall biosynthesis
VKKKILALCDNPVGLSGVGIQARYLFEGLLATGKYTIRCLGGALKNESYDVIKVSDDLIIKPVDGFGTRDMLRQLLVTEKPDVMLIFQDPRFFIWVWEMEDEIHQICPISYWHVWDNHPWPEFNRVLYESTDLLNCHSFLTYEMVHERFPEKTNFVPHALPRNVFQPIDSARSRKFKEAVLGRDKLDHFVGLWVNRNTLRKRPAALLEAWKFFIEDLEARHKHRKASLIMHTDPLDPQLGTNLYKVVDDFKLNDCVVFSRDRLEFEQMVTLHNIADFFINIANAEGFGLGTLEAMQCGKPIIATTTGGMTRQVIDHRDGSQNGIALRPEVRNLVGSLTVPYIYDDYVSSRAAADAIMRMYEMGPEERARLGAKARDYVLSEFDLDRTIKQWDESLTKLVDSWKANRAAIYQPWSVQSI